MNLHRRLHAEPIALQLAPMIDVILFLLVFFLLTWNLARYETDLDVHIPTAKNAKDSQRLPGEVILNLRKDGTVTLNRRPVPLADLRDILIGISKQYPDQAVVLRGDENVDYKYVIGVLDVCRAAGLWNIAFATNRPGQAAPAP